LAIRIFCNTAANVGGVVARDHFRAPEGWSVGPAPASGGWAVWRVAETGSTNADLVEAAAAGAPDRTVLVAAHQTAGRGRLDRRWEAPPGSNLLMSILVRVGIEGAGQLTRRVGLAAIDAVRAVSGAEARLKWPNDVLLAGDKLAGILAQATPAGDGVVVGIGLNVGWAPGGAARLGPQYHPEQVLVELLAAFDHLPDEIDARYRSALDTLGRQVRVELPGAELVGRAVDVDADGHLLVLDDCAITHRIDAGDVIHLRPAGA
jgi:BirA family biotin operon repressor/biotin-[acetyl-CoA-carboxylase] ligase